MHFLAQISAEALGPIVPWLVGASAIMFLANQALDFFKTHIREQPLPSDTYATKSEMREVHGRIKREREELNRELAEMRLGNAAIRTEMGHRFDALDDKRSDSIKGLHDAIATAVKDIRGELREDFKDVHDRVGVLVEKVGELDGRMQQ